MNDSCGTFCFSISSNVICIALPVTNCRAISYWYVPATVVKLHPSGNAISHFSNNFLVGSVFLLFNLIKSNKRITYFFFANKNDLIYCTDMKKFFN